MGLIKCPYCDGEISDRAKQCPHCNSLLHSNVESHKEQDNKKIKMIVSIIICSIVLIIVMALFGTKLGKYYRANRAYKAGNYGKAENIFTELGDYKNSEEMVSKSQKGHLILNDNTAPVFKNVNETTYISLGETFDFDNWVSQNGITISDNVTENITIIMDGNNIDSNTPGSYEIIISAEDEAGNQAKETVTVIVKDYPVVEAYKTAVNLTSDNIDELEIHISAKEADSPENGAIYRSIAEQLEGFYFGEEYYSAWGKSIVPVVFGFEKKDDWDEMMPYIDEAVSIINVNDPIGEIMSRISELSCVDGDFDFKNAECKFTITDLTKAAEELGISEEMLGYILAYFEEYAPKTSFTKNTYSCDFKFAGSREIDSDDFIFYEDFESKTNFLSESEEGSYQFFVHDSTDTSDFGENTIYGFSTYKGIQLGHSKDSVIFRYGEKKDRTFNASTDILYSAMIHNDYDEFASILKRCKIYSVYEYNSKQIAFYYDKNDTLICIAYFYTDAY